MAAKDQLLCAVNSQRFGVGLSWDHAGTSLDLDLQAIAFDKKGALRDAVYYNNMKALGKGLTHSGDERTGEKAGHDECVWANMQKLPADIVLIAYVVAVHSGGHLKNARNGLFHLVTDGNVEVGSFQLEQSDGDVDLVGALIRAQNGTWSFYLVHEDAKGGQHFMDILEPTIGNFVRRWIPGAPKRVKAAFAMEKGGVVDLPQSSVLKSVQCCLGWDTDQGDVDLDVSGIMLRKDITVFDACFFGKLECQGVKHSGDNLTGAGDGDDEIITVDLLRVPQEVEQIVFVINIYTRGKTFAQVANPYCRVVTSSGEEMCKYMLKEGGRSSGLIITRLFREPDNRWGFQAAGLPAKGTMYKDSIPEVTAFARKSPKEMQLMSRSTSSIGAGPPSRAGGSSSRGSSPDDQAAKSCGTDCVLQ